MSVKEHLLSTESFGAGSANQYKPEFIDLEDVACRSKFARWMLQNLNAVGAVEITPSGIDAIKVADELLEQLIDLSVKHGLIISDIEEQRKELSRLPQILHPKQSSGASDEEFVLLPWRRAVVHTVSREAYYSLLTSRNFPVISPKEQKRLSEIKVAIAGSSLGNVIAQALARLGITRFAIADAGNVSTEKIPLQFLVTDLGGNKAITTARAIAEINPYAEVEAHAVIAVADGDPRLKNLRSNGTSFVMLSDLLRESSIGIEAIDDLLAKFFIQFQMLRSVDHVIMPSDTGFGAVLKVILESPFNGAVSFEELLQELTVIGTLPRQEQFSAFISLAKRIIGPEIPSHLLEAIENTSVNDLRFLPQPNIAANLIAALTCATVVYLIRNEKLPDTLSIDLESFVTPTVVAD